MWGVNDAEMMLKAHWLYLLKVEPTIRFDATIGRHQWQPEGLQPPPVVPAAGRTPKRKIDPIPPQRELDQRNSIPL